MSVINNDISSLEHIVDASMDKLDSKMDQEIVKELISLCRELSASKPETPKKGILRKVVSLIKGGVGLAKDCQTLALIFNAVVQFVTPDAIAHGVDVSKIFLA